MKVRWQNLAGNTHEELTLTEAASGITAESTITGTGTSPFMAQYRIFLDSTWRVREFTLELTGAQKPFLESDGSGHWSDNTGQRPELTGAIDIDLAITPFTNTIPIRRLQLKPNLPAEILVVYISLPGPTVTTERQRYTCLVPGSAYRFEQPGSGFVRTIDVDSDGLVIRYPGLFRRL